MADHKHASFYAYDEWAIREEHFKLTRNLESESIFTVGNGYIGFRGNLEEGLPGAEQFVNNGTFLNGFYETATIRYPETAYGFAKQSQTMLNVTDAKGMILEVEGERFNLLQGIVHRHVRVLDMRKGLLNREIEWESPLGRQVRIRITRMVSFKRRQLAAIRYEVTPLNFNGSLRLHSVLNGKVSNKSAGDDPRVGAHGMENALVYEAGSQSDEGCWLRQRVRNSGFLLHSAVRHAADLPVSVSHREEHGGSALTSTYQWAGEQGKACTVTKYIAYVTTRDFGPDILEQEANNVLEAAVQDGFEMLAAEQKAFLDEFWASADIEITGDPAMQQGLRFNLYQLLQSAGRDGKTNIGAKGLSGEGYEGHYFWDTEMYIVPVFTYSKPEISRRLLEFRFNTLGKARQRAAEMSQKGALYPWRTIAGEETSAYFPAGTAQAHINADIAYAIQQYVRATGDMDFLAAQGAEVIIETARFWADLGYFNPSLGGRFCIDGVTGPDEYTAIVNNNAYTNLMARNHLNYAYAVVQWLKQERPERYDALAEELSLAQAEPERWKQAAAMMYIPTSEALGITAQDDSFLQKRKWDFEGTPSDKYPLLLHYHPLVIYRHQVLKQADVILAMVLLGDQFSLAEKIRNYQYYEPLTTHDSSLSPCTHSIMAAELGYLDKAYNYFMRTARMDLDDINHNVKDGLHTAAMAGAWLSVVQGFAGMRDCEVGLRFRPTLPPKWEQYRFKISYRNRLIQVHVTPSYTGYTLLRGTPITIRHYAEEVYLAKIGEACKVNNTVELQAVLFDLDGIVTDTAEYHYAAWKAIADELGIPFDRTINERLKGVGRLESFQIMLAHANREMDPAEQQVWIEKKNSLYIELIQQITPSHILPGIKPLLERLRQQGIRTALASASVNAKTILQKLELESYFHAVADPRSVAKGKPEPDLFIAAAEQLGVEPMNCIGIEDAAAGVKAIKSANMTAVAVGDTAILGAADLVVASTAELTLELLQRCYEANRRQERVAATQISRE